MPDARTFIDEDFVVVKTDSGTKFTLWFGDEIVVLGKQGGRTRVRVLGHGSGPFEGTVKGTPKTRPTGVLSVSMVDVQQGDGLILETPDGKIVFIDGGDNKLFARHAAARYRHRQSTNDTPLEIDAIVVTHGDADHFKGLNVLRKTETDKKTGDHQRLFIHPKRIYHNGLVKAPGTLPDVEMFGETATLDDGRLGIVALYDDPRKAPKALQNAPFKAWNASINHWEKRGPITLKRIAHGDKEDELFDFLKEEGIKVELQGPFPHSVTVDGESRDALPFLKKPKKSAEMHLDDDTLNTTSLSASHTINGHSISFRLTFGNIRFNLIGDLNRESMQLMRENLGSTRQLRSETVKAPHHGSHDFDFGALKAMAPVVSIISSGDEHAGKEHLHPRATLMAALGKVNRGNTGIIFSTELAAFFAVRKYAHTRKDLAAFFRARKDSHFTGKELAELFREEKPPVGSPLRNMTFFSFERTNFGIIHIRTDGERVLAFTHSGKKGLNEAYRFTVDSRHRIKFAKKVKIRT